MPKKKFYAVRSGRLTGVFNNWPETEKQVKGFAGAIYKGFVSLEEAEKWLTGDADSSSQSKTSKKLSRNYPAEINTDGKIIAYTDGGASGNPGPGGWGSVILLDKGEHEMSGGFRLTTNNRMELMACIKTLEFLKDYGKEVVLYSDSSYVVNGIEKGWAKSWKRKGWKKADGEVPKNRDLWQRLLELLEQVEVKFIWVKGHAGNVYNERSDRLAVAAWRKKDLPEDLGYGG